ncbi:adenylate/guanylate cyclase domain-containing protein [Cyanobium sp. CH-040]|nr:adenylate/guanylate cyclase domain-containing protein [Cyanobium sp. CH-040]
MIGSIFNIWYNTAIVKPLLGSEPLQRRFVETVIVYNAVVYPLVAGLWLATVYSLARPLRALWLGQPVPAQRLGHARRRVIELPWIGSALAALGWFLCIPVFILSLRLVGQPLGGALYWHLPISFIVSGTIAVTHSFFLVEITSQRRLFPWFFSDVRPDQTRGVRGMSLRHRGVLWAVSATVCPLLSLLMLSIAPSREGAEWFELYVAAVGIGFSLYTARLLNRLVAEPLEQLREAVIRVSDGDLSAEVPIQRADELGVLAAEVNHMIGGLRTAQQVRQAFGLHVGRKVADRLLARGPQGGIEELVTVMFVDIRKFTTRSQGREASEVVAELNEFLTMMVQIVEARHNGMINKFLGDGFMAIFGFDRPDTGADEALDAACSMLSSLIQLNASLRQRGQEPLAIGIGLHTGPAVLGSIGSADRMEFTAIGSTVNLASRIESLTKEVGVPLLFTATTRSVIRRPASDLGEHSVRGLEEPVRLFTVATG